MSVEIKGLKTIYNNKDETFITRGSRNWRHTKENFRVLEESGCHKDYVNQLSPSETVCYVDESFDETLICKKASNRQIFLTILRNIQFISRQGLAFRENNNQRNFEQLIKLSAKVDSRIPSWMEKKREKYLHHDTQNEIIRLMASIILRDKAKNTNDSIFYSIMTDETTDRSNKEQFIICFRWVDKGFDTHGDFIGINNVDNIKEDSLVTVIKDGLIRLNIPLSNARGQCYDGAKNMCGIKNGVSNKILSENPEAFFTRCFGHALNLAVGDMVKNARFLKDSMDTTYDISNLIKKSPKRDAMLQKIRKDISLEYSGFRVLCKG